jgi:hypothetical protein
VLTHNGAPRAARAKPSANGAAHANGAADHAPKLAVVQRS